MLDRTFGYEISNGKYRVQKTEAKYVRKIFQDVIDNRSYVQIAKWLNDNKVKTRKQGGKWSHTMVKRTILNRRYSGEIGRAHV